MLVEYKSEFLFAQTGRKDPANAAVWSKGGNRLH
jgi:hypothetical protein